MKKYKTRKTKIEYLKFLAQLLQEFDYEINDPIERDNFLTWIIFELIKITNELRKPLRKEEKNLTHSDKPKTNE